MSQADIAVIGLGVMGASLARNFHSRGLSVVGLKNCVFSLSM